MRYEYKCSECGCFIEEHPMGKQPKSAACPSCGSDCKQVISVGEVIIPARWGYQKAGIREVTDGKSMNDIRYDAELRKKWITA